MSYFVKESEEYILMEFTDNEFHQIQDILNKLILTENPEEIFTRDEIEVIANANKYTNLFFTYALVVSEDIQTHQGQLVGGGIINATSFFILLLLLFNTVLVDAGILKQSALHFKPLKSVHYGMSQRIISQTTIKLSKTVITLSNRLQHYTPPSLKEFTKIATITKHTAKITQIVIQQKRRMNELCDYIIENILLRKIQGQLKSKVILFIHSCFINVIVPLLFPELKEMSIQFADIILWCIQNKIPETFAWSKKIKKEVIDFYDPQLEYINYGGDKNTIKEKKRSFIGSKKNIKHWKKNAKITMKKTMMNRMMFPK